jgi:hypothetical protein
MAYKDPADQRENTNNWYQRNKEKHKKNVAQNKRNYRQSWSTFKSTLSCVKCGAAHPAIIDFHHVVRDGTKQSVNSLASDGRYGAAYEEIKKCIPLCANCHRILHWDEHVAKKRKRKKKR